MSGLYIKGTWVPNPGHRISILSDGHAYYEDMVHPYVDLGKVIFSHDHGDLADTSAYRDEFMSVVYDELSSDPDWTRANRIIDAYDSAPVIIPGDKENEDAKLD